MTRRVFVEVPIETVEQAEALPNGSTARKDDPDGWIDLAVKGSDGWARIDADAGARFGDHEMVGWAVLVPVDAEEGTDTIQTGADGIYTRSRYVTPWTPAP